MSKRSFISCTSALVLLSFVSFVAIAMKARPLALAFHERFDDTALIVAVVALFIISLLSGTLFINLGIYPVALFSLVLSDGLIVAIGLYASNLNSEFDSRILTVAGITILIFLIMTALGLIFPSLFARLSEIFFVALGIIIVVDLILMFVPIFDVAKWDLIIASFMSLYVAVDWGRYIEDEDSYDLGGAFLLAAEIYSDLVVVFMRILSALLSKDDD